MHRVEAVEVDEGVARARSVDELYRLERRAHNLINSGL